MVLVKIQTNEQCNDGIWSKKTAICCHLVVIYDFADVTEISLCKYQANITTDMWQQPERTSITQLQHAQMLQMTFYTRSSCISYICQLKTKKHDDNDDHVR